jgi:DNA-binding transcriptional MerR regulator
MDRVEDVITRTYTAGQAAKATGVPYNQINYWATSKFLMPSVQKANGSNTCRVYCFNDLVALRVVSRLRQMGLSLQGLRGVARHLQSRSYARPVIDDFLIVGENGEVVEKTERALLAALCHQGRPCFVFCIKEVVIDLMQIAEGLKPPSRGKACAVA